MGGDRRKKTQNIKIREFHSNRKGVETGTRIDSIVTLTKPPPSHR